MASKRMEAIKAAKVASQAQWAKLPFRKQIQSRAAVLDDDQRVLLQRLVSTYFNGHLKDHRGPAARLVSLSDFQLAFMDLLHPVRYDQIIAPAQEQLENYYEGSRKFASREFDLPAMTLRAELEPGREGFGVHVRAEPDSTLPESRHG